MGPPELQRNGNGFSLTSRAVPCRARCRNRPNCRNCPKSSRYSPAALARTSLVLWRLEPPPGRAWGYAPHTRSRSETCTTRKLLTAISRMQWDQQRNRTLKPDLSCRPSSCVLLFSAPVLWHCSPVPLSPLKTKQDCRNFAISKKLQSVPEVFEEKGEGPGGGKGSFFQKVPFPPSGNNSPLIPVSRLQRLLLPGKKVWQSGVGLYYSGSRIPGKGHGR